MNARERLNVARAAIAKERSIPEAEVHGWEAAFRAWSTDDAELKGEVYDTFAKNLPLRDWRRS